MQNTELIHNRVINNDYAPANKKEACVYDIFLNGEVVYVGMTNNPEKRLSSHISSGVAPDGANLVVHKWYQTREKALIEERVRQLQLRPAFCHGMHLHAGRFDEQDVILDKDIFTLMGAYWRDPIYPNAQAAYDAMPDDVRAQIKSLSTANDIFGKRKPGANAGRPKKNT